MASVVSGTYVLGRNVVRLEPPYQAEDDAFGATRIDGQTVADGEFKHCTFVAVSFKEAVIQRSNFLNCIFIGCYFRRAELRSSSFVGCRFIDCNFKYVAIKSSKFSYAIFQGCQVPFDELVHSLPSEPNVREELARNLFLESAKLGLSSEAGKYRMTEIRAREEHLSAAIRGESEWYRGHFDAVGRIRAAVELTGSILNRWLWGYGERAGVLVRNVLIVSVGVFPLLYFLFRDGFVNPSGGVAGWSDFLLFSVATIIPGGIESGLVAVGLVPRVLATLEALLGLVAIALFATHIFRWSLHR